MRSRRQSKADEADVTTFVTNRVTIYTSLADAQPPRAHPPTAGGAMSMMGAMAVQTDLRSAEARKKKLMGRRWLATGVGTIVAAATACLTFLARRPLGAEPALVDGLSGASPLSQTGWINLGSAFLIEDWLWDGMTAAERRSYDTPENPWRWHMSNLTKGQMESHLSSRISRANFAALAAYGARGCFASLFFCSRHRELLH